MFFLYKIIELPAQTTHLRSQVVSTNNKPQMEMKTAREKKAFPNVFNCSKVAANLRKNQPKRKEIHQGGKKERRKRKRKPARNFLSSTNRRSIHPKLQKFFPFPRELCQYCQSETLFTCMHENSVILCNTSYDVITLIHHPL